MTQGYRATVLTVRTRSAGSLQVRREAPWAVAAADSVAYDPRNPSQHHVRGSSESADQRRPDA